MNSIIGACWSITSECNMNCPICCRFMENGALTLEEKFQVIDLVSMTGIRKLNFAGGEPLLDPHILDLLEYSHSSGLKTALSTNGTLLTDELIEKLDHILDEMQLPLDGPNSDIHYLHRGSKQHFEIIVNLLPKVSSRKFQADVSTVVTSKNSHLLVDIASILVSSKIKKWKLFHFVPISFGYHHKEALEISEADFINAASFVKNSIDKLDIDYGIANPERLKSYFNISPMGNFYLPNGSTYKSHGNIMINNNLIDLAEKAGFNFEFHTKRFWRDIKQFKAI